MEKWCDFFTNLRKQRLDQNVFFWFSEKIGGDFDGNLIASYALQLVFFVFDGASRFFLVPSDC